MTGAASAGASAPLPAAQQVQQSEAAQQPRRLDDALRAQFNQNVVVQAIRVPKERTNQYMKQLSKHLFNKPRLRNVLEDSRHPDMRLLLLDEILAANDLDTRQLGGEAAQTLSDFVRQEGLGFTTATVEVDYSYWPAHVVLQRLLPPGVEVPNSFESVGHIAHLNLREELLPHKHIIGQVILDKNPRLKTVVNKVASIENEFRVFPMEVLAGEEGTETEVRQHGARFKLDFKKVYWNSRLEREHQRLVALFKPGEVVVDAMAGIGPFAVPAAQKGCLVYANDLNPASYEYLCTNIRLNRLGGKVLPFNADGREFMRQAAAGQLDVAAASTVVPAAPSKAKAQKKGQTQQKGDQQQRMQQQCEKQQQAQQGGQQALAQGRPPKQQQHEDELPQQRQPQAGIDVASTTDTSHPGGTGNVSSSAVFHHIVMNLPATAVEFLDALQGAFCPQMWQGHRLPLVHVYTFAKGEEELAGLRQRVEVHLGGQLDDEPQLHVVRDVAPKKLMVAVTFRVPASVAFTDNAKRQRLQ